MSHISPAVGLPLMLAVLMTSVATAPVLAQTAPDAGQVLRETRDPLTPPVASERPVLTIPAEAEIGEDDGRTVRLEAIRIEGAGQITSDELGPLVDHLTGRDVTLSEIRAGARRVTAYYRQHGYIVARAYIPAQEIADGLLIIRVLEGQLSRAAVENHTIVRTQVLQSVLRAQQLEGKLIAASTTDRALLLMADLPGVGKVSGALHPGTEVGTSDLVVLAEKGSRFVGQMGLDNFGNRYTGQNRLNGQVAINSPLGIGDRLSLQGSLTDENLAYGRLAYDLPVGGKGLRFGAAASVSTYELGRNFADLEATGTAESLSLYASYPLVRGLRSNVWLNVTVEQRSLEDEIRAVNALTEKSAETVAFEIYGDHVDSFHGGGYTTWRLSALSGDLSIDTPSALAADHIGPRTAGGYKKINASVSRIQSLAPRISLLTAFSLQSSSKNLDSSEKFVIGGINGVRAYPQGEGSGDKGWLANIELRHQTLDNLQLSAFYDAGRVHLNRLPYMPGDNHLSLRGYGLSALTSISNWSGKVTVAWRDTQNPTTAPSRSPKVWASVGYRF